MKCRTAPRIWLTSRNTPSISTPAPWSRPPIHVAGHNLGILMRLLIGAGTPKKAAARREAFLVVVHTEKTPVIIIFAAADADFAILIVAVTARPT